MNDSERKIPLHQPRGLLETVVYTENLDAARCFYEEVLGLELVSAEEGRHLFFRVGASMLLVFDGRQTSKATVLVNNQTIPRHGASGPSHFAFSVNHDQIEPIRKHLQKHQVAIESEIAWPGGGHSLYCRDPDGNSVEFATQNLWFGPSA